MAYAEVERLPIFVLAVRFMECVPVVEKHFPAPAGANRTNFVPDIAVFVDDPEKHRDEKQGLNVGVAARFTR